MNPLLRFKLHIFDLDDTLLDTSFAYTTAQKTAIQEAFPDLSEAETSVQLSRLRWLSKKFGTGNVLDYMRAYLMSLIEPTVDIENTLALMESVYNNSYWSLLGSMDGAIKYLQAITEHGRRISLVSNGNEDTQRKKIKYSELDRYFPDNACYISGQFSMEKKKPSPFMIEKACQDIGISRDQSVFYGNSIDDVLSGNLAGVTTALIGRSDSSIQDVPNIAVPDYVFKNWYGDFTPMADENRG